uniref:Histo-blood group ABO system transferase-like n=1 Tax=Mustela putorius furo TaxID=9669 RepID=M3XSB7_MUSPF
LVVFLELFLQRSEKPIMVGHRGLHQPVGCLVCVPCPPELARELWDVSMQCMAMVSHLYVQDFLHEMDNLVCVDVDMKFWDYVGMETLSPLFGTLHPSFYQVALEETSRDFRYQHWPHAGDQGEVYYMEAFLGELVVLTLACHQVMRVDLANWHDVSHLNMYLLDHKPTKVLSLEYLWDLQQLGCPTFMEKLIFVTVPKNRQDIQNS